MSKIQPYFSNSKFIIASILSIFLIEFFVTIYLKYSINNSIRLVGMYKIFFFVIILCFLKSKKIDFINLVALLVLSFLFLINQFLNPTFNENFESNLLKGSIYYTYRFLYIFLFILVFRTIENHKSISLKALRYIEYILLFNAILILIGVLWNIDLLASYPNTPRYGSDGLFNKVNESSYLYIVYTTSLYFNYLRDKKSLLKLIFIIIISLLIGTKTVILFFMLLFVIHVFLVSNANKRLKLLLGAIIIMIIFFYNKIAEFYFRLIPFWNKILEEHDVTTLLFSKRDYLLRNNIEYVNSNWDFFNFLIGGSYYTKNFKLTQMDGPDLLLFFGLLGFLLYLFFFFKNYLIKESIIFNLIIISILVCGLLSGGLFLSVMVMVYLYLLKLKQKTFVIKKQL